MTTPEVDLLEQFKAYLNDPFEKRCVDAYLKKAIASAITKEAFGELKRAIDETA